MFGVLGFRVAVPRDKSNVTVSADGHVVRTTRPETAAAVQFDHESFGSFVLVERM